MCLTPLLEQSNAQVKVDTVDGMVQDCIILVSLYRQNLPGIWNIFL